MQLKRLEINNYTINKRTYIDRIMIKYTVIILYTQYSPRYRKVGDSAFLTTRFLSIDFLFSLYSNVAHCKFFR